MPRIEAKGTIQDKEGGAREALCFFMKSHDISRNIGGFAEISAKNDRNLSPCIPL
jgi:hypothetical protein